MKLRNSSLLLMTTLCLSAQIPDLAGDWNGSLTAGGSTLRLALHVTRTDIGLAATLDSVDQSAFG